MAPNLLAYTAEHIRRHPEYSTSMREKLSAMHTGLSLFLGDKGDAPLLSAIDPEWVAAYGRFLFGGDYGRAMKASGRKGKFDRIAPRTLAMQLVLLRSIVRQAIRDGLLPAVDVFPEVGAKLKGEFQLADGDLRELLGGDTARAYALRAHDFEAEAKRLATILLPRLSTRPGVKKSLPALIYLMGIYAYGLEPHELLELRDNYELRTTNYEPGGGSEEEAAQGGGASSSQTQVAHASSEAPQCSTGLLSRHEISSPATSEGSPISYTLSSIHCEHSSPSSFESELEEFTFVHPRLGIAVPMPERALRVAALINRGIAPDGYFIRRPKGWAGMSSAEIAEQLVRSIAMDMRKTRLGLFLGSSVYADWLAMLKQGGAADSLVSSLARVDSDTDSSTLYSLLSTLERSEPPFTLERSELLSTLQHRILESSSLFRKRWYILCSYTAAMDSTALRAHIVKYLREHGVRFDKARESYDPQMIEKRLVRGKIQKRNNPAISRYLFVYCTEDTAALIDKMDSNASFLRVIGQAGRFATVAHADVVGMVNFLRDFRDDVQLLDIAVGADGKRSFAEGVRVKILSGPFAGFEGTIAQVIKIKQDKSLSNNELRGGGYFILLRAEL